VAVFNANGEIVEQQKFETPQSYGQFLTELANTVDKLSTKEFISVGAAAPGIIDHEDGLLVVAGNLTWKNVPIQKDFENIFHVPVLLENDAKAATLAEAKTAGENYSTVLYLTISTGVGMGVCQNGKLVSALSNAEPGWMSIENDGVMTPWEKLASGKALVERTGKRASDLTDDNAWDLHASYIAKGLIAVLSVIQPDIVVMGGGVGNHLEKFKEPLLKYLKDYENQSVKIPPIVESAHPEEAVIYGCYQLAKTHDD